MKHIKYTKFFGWFAATVLLLTTSCNDDMFGTNSSSDEVTVSFTLAPEAAATLSTRGKNYEGGNVTYPDKDSEEYAHISDGSKADILIYAVYDEKGNLLEGYSGDSDTKLGNSDIDLQKKPGDGQTIKYIEYFPYTLTLTLKRGETYTVAFWAQNHKTNAYNTSDLKKVEVIYSELDDNGESLSSTTTPNNDEFRDAFCQKYTFTAGASDDYTNHKVLLYRPLAQINVGTSGYDFEAITRNADKKYLYSKIRLNRVARYLDVVADKTITSTTNDDTYGEHGGEKTPESFAVVDFGYAPLPAYVNWKEKTEKWVEYPDYPQYPSYTLWDWKYNEAYEYPHTIGNKTSEQMQKYYTGEEFLKVHLYKDKDGEIEADDSGVYKDKAGNIYTAKGEDDYRQYANLTNHNDELSETFKYLSMCYVLTSSTQEDKILINNVKAWLATDENGADEIQILDLNNVPAQRNWRTNIVGNLLTEEAFFNVTLDKDFAGEYNGWAVGDLWKWSGPLADGVYYDAENDEIQISNANGLIWFQRMVNGKMTIREALKTNMIGEYYTYYNTSDKEITFTYDGINETDENLKNRILKATHQEEWPKNNNFHFYGEKKNGNGEKEPYPAKVKLMADIDLTGIEWIPIGFDGRILETVDKTFEENVADNRGFYGIFDGNNHTISNLTTKRFGSRVPDWSEERSSNSNDKNKYVDNLQWFGRGLFGEIGGDAEIKNVRLLNPDIYGCHGVGGIVGIAYGNAIKITNCVVDGGSLIVTPLYRGDTRNGSGQPQSRTFARGVYLGGIVGYFNTVGGQVDNCEVKNMYMRGYRRVGGLIGSVDLGKKDNGNGKGEKNEDDAAGTKGSNSTPKSITNNRISNTVLIASQFSAFGLRHCIDYLDGKYKTGFGWDNGQFNLYAQKFVGGDSKDYVEKNENSDKVTGNVANGLTFAEFTEVVEDGVRYSTMQKSPLKYMPILSSWFTDNIMLYENYYGEPSAKTIMNIYNDFEMFSSNCSVVKKENGSATTDHYQELGTKADKYHFPMQLPGSVEIEWNDKGKNAGLYVESVTLDGYNSIGKRSVITPTKVDEEGACALFVTARDRKEFYDKVDNNFFEGDKSEAFFYKAPTIIKNIVVRGSPYAYTGILLSPNENMEKVELDNVAIYDVYQTLALNNSVGTKGEQWPHEVVSNGISLSVKNSNFRGYTIPGAGWSEISYESTTFEEGTFIKSLYTNENKEMEGRTYKAEARTTFNKCFFKAPYIIDLSEAYKAAGESAVTFNNCYATAASTANMRISLEGKTDVTRIIIGKDAQGNPTVEYLTDSTTQSAKRR